MSFDKTTRKLKIDQNIVPGSRSSVRVYPEKKEAQLAAYFLKDSLVNVINYFL